MSALTADAGSRVKLERIVDIGERLFLLILATYFFLRFVPKLGAHPHLWFIVISEALVIAFVLARPWNAPISTRPRDIVLALLTSCLALLVSPLGARPHYLTLAGIVMTFGMLLSLSGKIALNRRFGAIAANRGIQVRGPFRLIRHPIYTGYAITHVGFLIANPYWWNALLYGVEFSLQLWRMSVEEEVLRQDPAYVDYAERVRFKLMPGVY